MFFDEVPWCFEEVPEVSESLRSEAGCRAQWGCSVLDHSLGTTNWRVSRCNRDLSGTRKTFGGSWI